MVSRSQPSSAKRYPPVDTIKAARIKERRQRRNPAADHALEQWEVARDILYRMPLCRNDPKEFCPGEQFERVSKEIVKALT